MKKIILTLLILVSSATKALANPACAVCTIAIGASLGLARELGVEDAIVGLWAGALLTLLGYWTITFFDKKGWQFWGRDFLLMFISVGMIGFIYVSEVSYRPTIIWHLIYLDPILFSAILGMLLFIFSQKFYQWLKAKNNGRAHFPFEKVVLPLVFLGAASFYLTYFPIAISGVY